MSIFDFLRSPVWALKQLFPMTYRTHYSDEAGDHFVVWKMWLGRCFQVDDVVEKT